MNTKPNYFAWVYWIVTALIFMATMIMLKVYTPVEETMGVVQKIFYIHLPVALSTFVAAFVMFVASLGYLWQRKLWWDDLAAAAGKVMVLYCSVLLITGILWGRSAWGAWWTWSPRLTFSLTMWLLYVVYLILRPAIESPQRRAMVASLYGAAAFLDIPLVYLSVQLMDDIHPASIRLAPEMKTTLLIWFLPVAMLLAGLIMSRYKLNRVHRQLEQHDLDLANGLVDEQTGGAV